MILDMPPAIYDHAPKGPVIEYLLPREKAIAECTQYAPAGSAYVACSYKSGRTCIIIIPDLKDERTELYRRHERAHCNGWSAKHEHAVKLKIRSPVYIGPIARWEVD